jgi:putative transposase
MFEPRRSSPRLNAFSYEGLYAYLVTVNTHRKVPFFRSPDAVRPCQEKLLSVAQEHGFEVLAYCFMPDHLHLLVQGSADSKLVTFMKQFKQVTGYGFKNRRGPQLWQRSYYDHVLRKDEDKRELAGYIWNNPVKAGLAASPAEYPFSGPPGDVPGQT